MKEKIKNSNLKVKQSDNEKKTHLPGYPVYPASEDIYNKQKEVKNINPDDGSIVKPTSELNDDGNEIDFSKEPSIDDLDIPGTELDDEQESNGNEDEENNYYSLGGDEHNNLDEDKGE